jgi:Mn-dependent DtxR family transcriptional regulator|tara:strand:+ start:918 stop:1178 length:261 start_codon:yes stop_codon:yes gene_type:complete
MKETESYEQLLHRFTKRVTQLEMRQVELEEAHLEYVKLDRELDRLEGSIQAVEYLAFGKMPGDGNHDGFKPHKPKPQQINDLGSLD